MEKKLTMVMRLATTVMKRESKSKTLAMTTSQMMKKRLRKINKLNMTLKTKSLLKHARTKR
jgi:hypothetical protein